MIPVMLLWSVAANGLLVYASGDTQQNEIIQKWTFDSEEEFNRFVVDLNTGAKAYENGMAKLIGSGTYTYPFDGTPLTVGREYIITFKAKTASPGAGGYFAVFNMYPDAGNIKTTENRKAVYPPPNRLHLQAARSGRYDRPRR